MHKLQASVSPVSGLTRAYASNPSCLLNCDVQEESGNGSPVQLTWQDSSLTLYSFPEPCCHPRNGPHRNMEGNTPHWEVTRGGCLCVYVFQNDEWGDAESQGSGVSQTLIPPTQVVAHCPLCCPQLLSKVPFLLSPQTPLLLSSPPTPSLSPPHLTCLPIYLHASQEATVRSGHGTTDWFQIGKRVCQGCIFSPCLFNLYAGYIMRNARLDEAQAGIKIARRNINNLRYADDTTFPILNPPPFSLPIPSLWIDPVHQPQQSHTQSKWKKWDILSPEAALPVAV